MIDVFMWSGLWVCTTLSKYQRVEYWIIFTILISHATSFSETIAEALYSVMFSKWAPSSCGIFCIISFSLTQSTIHWKKFGLKGTWENSQCLISSNNRTHSINLPFYIKTFLSYLYLYACLFSLSTERICSKDKLRPSNPEKPADRTERKGGGHGHNSGKLNWERWSILSH